MQGGTDTEYITGTIDSGRVLNLGTVPAYTGEQNAAALKIDLSYWSGRNPGRYIICFETSPLGEVFITAESSGTDSKNAYIEDGFLICPLSAGLTSTGFIKVQLSAVFTESDGTETVEKTSVASFEYGPSIAVGSEYYGSDSTIYGEIEKLKKEISGLSFAEEFSFDYFAAAIAARLLFISFESTPVYFPETAEKAEKVIFDLTASFDSDTMKYALIVVPSDTENTARLCIFGTAGNTVSIKYCSGVKLLEILKTGVNI